MKSQKMAINQYWQIFNWQLVLVKITSTVCSFMLRRCVEHIRLRGVWILAVLEGSK